MSRASGHYILPVRCQRFCLCSTTCRWGSLRCQWAVCPSSERRRLPCSTPPAGSEQDPALGLVKKNEAGMQRLGKHQTRPLCCCFLSWTTFDEFHYIWEAGTQCSSVHQLLPNINSWLLQRFPHVSAAHWRRVCSLWTGLPAMLIFLVFPWQTNWICTSTKTSMCLQLIFSVVDCLFNWVW